MVLSSLSDTAFSDAKKTVGWLQRATWQKRYRVRLKGIALLQNCEMESKNVTVVLLLIIVLFEKIDKYD